MIISLTGGLGNQLFQMYAGLSFDKNQVRLTSKFGNPRKTCGLPDLLHFQLPHRVEVIPSEDKGIFSHKAGGFALRSGLLPNSNNKFFVPKFIIDSTMDLYFSVTLKERVSTFSSAEVGLSSISPSGNKLVFGYFQTYKYFHALRTYDKEISLKIKTQDFSHLKDMAKIERPVVVHIRLGDYVEEKHFGTLSLDYYSKALRKLGAESSTSPIWIFSDDSINALKLLPSELRGRCFVVPKENLSPAETLELMRYGSAYVIANSSFSWWAATLSYTEKAPVVAPEKWFAGMQDPRELLPSDWMTELR